MDYEMKFTGKEVNCILDALRTHQRDMDETGEMLVRRAYEQSFDARDMASQTDLQVAGSYKANARLARRIMRKLERK